MTQHKLYRFRITEKAPNAEKIVHDLKAVQALTKQLERQLEARDSRRRANETGRNRSQQEDAQRNKAIALKTAAALDRTLRRRGKISELAGRVWARWPNSKRPSIRTIRRWLTEK